MSAPDISELQKLLGHSFADPELLETALSHRSFANERRQEGAADNEKLEFLGDAVLDLIIGHDLMDHFPSLSEGDLSMTRSRMVSEAGLSRVARALDLGRWLRLGRGEEQSGGRDKSSLLADTLEAVIAALYLDGGLEVARRFALAHFEVPAQPGVGDDFKTRLQELVHGRFRSAPVYELVSSTGPDHDKRFEVAVIVDGTERARASGRSKKFAEQEAASRAVAALEVLSEDAG